MGTHVVTFNAKGDFKDTVKILTKLSNGEWLMKKLDEYGRMGVEALANATPVDTGKTSQSWEYEKTIENGKILLIWKNTNIAHYFSTKRGSSSGRRVSHYANIAIIIDTGHATGTGGYVSGYHYIEPAIRPVFDRIAKDLWKEVASA